MRSRQRGIRWQGVVNGARAGAPSARDAPGARLARREFADEAAAERVRWEVASAATRAGGFQLDLATGRLDGDERARAVFGVSAEECPHTREALLEMVVPEDAARVAEAFDAAVDEAEEAAEEDQGVQGGQGGQEQEPLFPASVQFRIRRRVDGARRRIAAHSRLVPGAARLVGVVRDITEEHDLASWLQRVMLPRTVATLPGVAFAVRYACGSSERELGGDWYDVIPLPAGRVALVIGDVMGHNLHAAAVMGQLRAALRAYATEGHDPATVAARASRFLADMDTGLFATCTYVDLDTATGVAETVRAGHLAPLLRGPRGDCAWVAAEGGVPLGIEPDAAYPVTRIELDPGAVLLLCTDGAVDSGAGPGGPDDSGAVRLRERLAAAVPADLDATADEITATARAQRSRGDDIALLLARWDAPADHLQRRRLSRSIDPSDLVAVSRARRQLRGALRRWGVSEVADTAELLASELVTNALVHTDHGAVLSVTLSAVDKPEGGEDGADGEPAAGPRFRLRVEVHDRASRRPVPRTAGDQASSGRGLLLVQALADDWGVRPRGEGKVTWFQLLCP